MSNIVRINLKGPIFKDAYRKATLLKMRKDILNSVTKYAYNNVMRILKTKIRDPRPYYWTTIVVDGTYVDSWRVTDKGDAIYNHWLEGTGSRNFPVTSFKGYHAWKRASELTQNRAQSLAETQVRKAVKRLGG